MIEKDAIKELALTEATTAAGKSVATAIAADSKSTRGAAALPNDFTIHDLEKYMPTRRRVRGNMQTMMVADFAKYAQDNAEEGAAVFVDADSMTACAVLNLGTPKAPGHADNASTLTMKKTAAYAALRSITTEGRQLSQVDVAEFLEDWAEPIVCEKDGEHVPIKKAIASIRKLSIEAMRKIENSEQQLSATRSAFEKIEATSEEPIPTGITFTCKPYKELEDRTFTMRLSILTSGDKPKLTLRIIKIEEHEEQMAGELADVIRKEIGSKMPVMLGKYAAK